VGGFPKKNVLNHLMLIVSPNSYMEGPFIAMKIQHSPKKIHWSPGHNSFLLKYFVFYEVFFYVYIK
jgi:hypothetical protein